MKELKVAGITVTIGEAHLLEDVSCRMTSGRLIGLIGPNGAGKSTLVRCLLRLQEIDRGRIWWDGKEITQARPHELSDSFAYLAQSQTVHWPLTVSALVALGRKPSFTPFSRLVRSDLNRVDQAMEQVEVGHLKDRAITTLSGGERARALLARVLASDASVIVADEPVAALDPYHQMSILQVLKGWVSNGGLAIIVLHDLSLARRFCDDLILLKEGQVVAAGESGSVLRKQYLEPVYQVEFDLSATGAVLPLARRSSE